MGLMKLKTKDKPIPNGFVFAFAALPNWKPKEASRWSWTALVDEVFHLIQANPAYQRRYQWPKDRGEIEDWVEQFNVAHASAMGWTEYLEGGPAKGVPFSRPQLNAQVASVGAAVADNPPAWYKQLGQVGVGLKTLGDWLGDEAHPVPTNQSEERARICATCPQNQKGDWRRFFTKPASELIRRQLEERTHLNLKTSVDAELGICAACGCPLRLKSHVPLKYITAHLPAEDKKLLDPKCWILAEAT